MSLSISKPGPGYLWHTGSGRLAFCWSLSLTVRGVCLNGIAYNEATCQWDGAVNCDVEVARLRAAAGPVPNPEGLKARVAEAVTEEVDRAVREWGEW